MSISRTIEDEKQDNNIYIPKIIHAIWAGGFFRLPVGGNENMIKWAALNPEFEVWLWVDKKTTSNNVLNQYTSDFVKTADRILNFELQSELPHLDQKPSLLNIEFVISKIKLKDIGDEDLRNEYIAYEIEKLYPNYGSSSDLLRYKILHKFGGLYIDVTDVYPNKSYPLIQSEIFHNYYSDHYLYVDHLSQIPSPKKTDLEIFNLNSLVPGKVGNDTLICTQNNPLMKQIIEKVEENYDIENNNLSNRIRNAHDSKNIKFVTIARTGPEVIGNVLQKYVTEDSQGLSAKFMDGEKKCYVQVNPIKDLGRQLAVSRSKNTQKWLNVDMTLYNNKNDVLNAIENTISFEAKHFKILRLDDHVNDYIASFDEFEADDKIFHNQCADEIIARLANIKELSQDDLFVQIIGKFQASIDFCKQKNWQSILNLADQEIYNAIYYQSSIKLMDDYLLPRINLIKDFIITKLETSTNPIDPERLRIAKNSIRTNSSFSFNDFKKISDAIGLSDEYQLTFFNLSDMNDTRDLLVDAMAQGIASLEYYVNSLDIRIDDFEAGKRLLNRYTYYGELLNLSISLNPPVAACDPPKAHYVPVEKIPNLLVVLIEKEQLKKDEVVSEVVNERPRRGGSCCNVS